MNSFEFREDLRHNQFFQSLLRWVSHLRTYWIGYDFTERSFLKYLWTDFLHCS